MKCLILAAGQGSRLWQKGNSKPLVRLLGVPLIERTIRSAIEADIDEFLIVTGYHGDRVRSFLDNLTFRCPSKITHVINDRWDQGNGLSVLAAKEHFDEPFLLLMADHLFDPSILRDLASQDSPDGQIMLAVDRRTENSLVDLDDVTRVNCENGQVLDIGKGLKEFNGFDTGIFLCTPAIFDALEQSIEGHGDSSLSAGVRHLASQGRVNVFDIDGRFWCDMDNPEDLDKAERALLMRLRDKPSDGPVSHYMNRPLSVRISRVLSRLPITPNQISFLSFILCLVATWLFMFGGYLALALGGVIAQLASVVDGCDGEIARLKFLKSDFGAWFDAVLDRYADAFLLFGLTWHAHFVDGPLSEVLKSSFGAQGEGAVLVVGFLAIVGSFINSYTADKYDGLMRKKCCGRQGIRIGRDVRTFWIFLCTLGNFPLVALLVLAILTNVENVRRVILGYRHELH